MLARILTKDGPTRDLSRARALLLRAVNGSNAKAVHDMALFLYTGLGHVAPDKQAAIALLKNMADRAEVQAMLELLSQAEPTIQDCVDLGLQRMPVALPDVVRKGRHIIVRHTGSADPDFAARLLVCTVDAGIVLRVADFDWKPKVVALQSAADFSLAVVTTDASVYFRNYRFQIFNGKNDVPLSDFMCKDNLVGKSTGRRRKCRGCGGDTAHGLSKCLHCHHNWHDTWMGAASFVPFLGLPITAARATLRQRQRAIDLDDEGTGTAVGMSVAGVTLAHVALGSLLGGVVSAVHSSAVGSGGSGDRSRPAHVMGKEGPAIACSSHLLSKGSGNSLLFRAMRCRCKGCELVMSDESAKPGGR